MRKIGPFIAIFAASLLGVLAAFQIDRFTRKGGDAGILSTDKDFPYATPVSLTQVPAGPPDFVEAAKRIVPSVVSVDQRVAVRDFFSDRVEVQTSGSGSGVIISADGLILTNNHVIAGGQFWTVRTPDGKAYSAKIVGADPKSDLAVIKIEASNLTPAELGDSTRMQVGQWVLTVGNPLGYSGTVAAGVVSSLGRTLPENEGNGLLIDAIQTDAAINPGNSGGALTNAQGQVVGINTLIASNTGGSVGLGFAIPINRAKKVVHDIMQYGHVRYGEPGLTISPHLLQEPGLQDWLANQVNATPPRKGLLVINVDQNGPAAKAGIRQLDVIESIDGKPLDTPVSFARYFADKKPGDTVDMRIWEAGNEKVVKIQLEDINTF